MSSLPDVCCKIEPVKSDYKPRGQFVESGDLKIYVVEPDPKTYTGKVKGGAIVIYDIFGVHPNTQQFCDLLADTGLKIAMPDFFRGKACDPALSKDRQKLTAWIGENASWEKVKPDLEATKKLFTDENINKVGVAGFCWGGKLAIFASSDKFYAAAVLIHPAALELDDVEKSQAPLFFMPSMDEPDMEPYLQAAKIKPSYHHRFTDVHHGFAGSRGDYNDETIRKRSTEVIQYTSDFFAEVIKA